MGYQQLVAAIGPLARATAPGEDGPRGHHIFWTYASDGDHQRVLTTFLLEGLRNGERTCYFGFGGSEVRIIGYLRAARIDVYDLIRAGRLVIGSAVDGYLPEGVFDADARIDGFEALVNETLDAGYPGLRVAAETGWLLEDENARDAWPAYEVRAELLTARLPIVGLCAFDARGADPHLLTMIAGLHRSTHGTDANTSTFHIHATAPGALALSGALDATFAGIPSDALIGAIDDLPSTLDVRGCGAVDDDGMRAVARLVDAIDARGDVPQLNGASPAFRRLWEMMTLDPQRRAVLA